MSTKRCPECKETRIPTDHKMCQPCADAQPINIGPVPYNDVGYYPTGPFGGGSGAQGIPNSNGGDPAFVAHYNLPPIPPVQSSALTLPTDSAERKDYPLLRGCLRYFPAALAGVARTSKLGNDKHNPGEELHHARGKSTDHGDCILRHLVDLQDLLASAERNGSPLTPFGQSQILAEASSLCWRALALSQELHERFGAPLAPGAKLE